MANVGQTKTPQWALDEIEKCQLEKGRVLNLSRQNRFNAKCLSKMPEEVFELIDLQTLNMNGNQLAELPETLKRLTNLKYLWVSYNKFSALPKVITQLTNLTHLDVSGNKLVALPEGITQLTSLTHLDVSGNKLVALPEGITEITNLTYLWMSHNQLVALPEAITQLADLQVLHMGNNQLAVLPEAIAQLKNLQELDIRNNPLQDPPLEIAEKGIDAIREYFAQKRKQGAAKLYEAKLMLLGEGGTGKTSLARKLQDAAAPLPKDEETTWGVDIQAWSFSMKDGTPFRVNVWDFGGQQIYHQTHQFFLTHRSVYALLTDCRKEHTDFDYWLDSAQLFGGDSPLIIVSNEKEDRREEIPENDLRARFEQFKGVWRTNLKTGRGLPKLRNEIEHLLCALPHVGASLPSGWVRVREALEKDPRNYISQDEFIELCGENGIDREEDALQLSGYLHDIGVILHFKDDPELDEMVILKPEWATQAVYGVVQNPGVVNAGGRFTRANLNAIWNDEQHKHKRTELLVLMRKFRLCYEIVGQPNNFILPQLLPDDVPNYEPIAAPTAQLHYKYGFMPKGILAQLIVRLNTLIEVNKSDRSERSDRFEVWKTGVILAKNGARAEVIEDRRERKVRVKVSGNTRNQLLSFIAHEMGEIHSSFRGQLKVDALIPCVCEGCSQGDPHFFAYGDLIRRQERGKPTIECNKSFDNVNVQAVLDGAPFDEIDRVKFKKYLADNFNKAELEELLFEFRNLREMPEFGERLDLEAVGLKEMGKEQLIVRIIEYCDRREILAALYRLAHSKRKG